MSQIRKRSFATLALATMLGGLSAFAVASPAAAAGEEPPPCQYWYDKNTFGVSCTDWGAGRYQAAAQCSNGQWYQGPLVTTGWSYVYCSTYGATYVPGTGGLSGTGGG